jgi:hypothetical protein
MTDRDDLIKHVTAVASNVTIAKEKRVTEVEKMVKGYINSRHLDKDDKRVLIEEVNEILKQYL